METGFTREDTKIIKGTAVILMLMHHLWGFPDRIAGGSLRHLFTIFGESSILYLGLFGKICVSLFFFVGGYGIYKGNQHKEFDIVEKLKGLYISYWKVFVIFIPIGFLFFANQPIYSENALMCDKYALFSWEDVLLNFFGFSNSFNDEWWFLRSYICAIITFPLIKKLCDKYSSVTNISMIIVGSILVTNVFPALGKISEIGKLNHNFLYKAFFCQMAPYIVCFWMGCVMAKGDLLTKLQIQMKKNRLLNPLMDILILGAVIFLRQTATGDSLDIIYVPIYIIVILDLVKRVRLLMIPLLLIGKQSTNMWLIHSFFCYYFYRVVKIIVAPKWAVPSLILLIIITFAASITVTYFWYFMGKIVCRVKCKSS